MELQYTIINGRKIIARDFFLKALTLAHEDIVQAGIEWNGISGFVLANEETGSWRSEVMQKQLLAKGASKTLYSNHRIGTAVDCVPDWDYINHIKPFMNNYGLVNDLAEIWDAKKGKMVPWDGGHWNWKSNKEAQQFDIISSLPLTLKQFSMNEYDGGVIFLAEPNFPESGSFAGVYDHEKHIISKERAGLAALHPLIGAKKAVAVNKLIWDSIPTGKTF